MLHATLRGPRCNGASGAHHQHVAVTAVDQVAGDGAEHSIGPVVEVAAGDHEVHGEPLAGLGDRHPRITAPDHRRVRERVRTGAFREDLRYRLDVVSIDLPALRHRRDDIPLLLDHYLRVARARHPGSTPERISPAAMARLVAYRWPGNVRELSHAVERMVLLCRSDEIGLGDLPAGVVVARPAEGPEFTEPVLPIRDLTRRYALWALGRLGGHRTRTASVLGIDMKTLAKWLSEAEGRGEDG